MHRFYKYLYAIPLVLALVGCKAPMPTIIKDEVKENVPKNFENQKNDFTQKHWHNAMETVFYRCTTSKTDRNCIGKQSRINEDLSRN